LTHGGVQSSPINCEFLALSRFGGPLAGDHRQISV
jgi:hypothetical protein